MRLTAENIIKNDHYHPLCFIFFVSFMMVGDPFSGKTTVLQVLAEAMTTLQDRGYDDENINKVLYYTLQIKQKYVHNGCESWLLRLRYEQRASSRALGVTREKVS